MMFCILGFRERLLSKRNERMAIRSLENTCLDHWILGWLVLVFCRIANDVNSYLKIDVDQIYTTYMFVVFLRSLVANT